MSAALVELVDADDVPTLPKAWYPLKVGRAAREPVSEVDHLVNTALSAAQLANGVRQVWWKIGVKQESHAAKLRCELRLEGDGRLHLLRFDAVQPRNTLNVFAFGLEGSCQRISGYAALCHYRLAELHLRVENH